MPSGGAARGCPHWAQVGWVMYAIVSQQCWHTQGSGAPRVLRLHTRQRGGRTKSSSARTAPSCFHISPQAHGSPLYVAMDTRKWCVSPGCSTTRLLSIPRSWRVQTVGRARIGLNTDCLPRSWRGEDHHMWKLGDVKRHGGRDTALLVLECAAHQPVRICDKIGVDIVENQGRYVSWLAQIVWSVHREELAGRETIL